MSSSTTPDGPAVSSRPSPAGRRRGERLETAILTAAREELAAVGYAHLTMEAVAVRARTSKPVLYRRWPSRALLVLAVMRQGVPAPDELPDTGNLRSDLIALLCLLVHRMDELPPDLIPGLLTDALRDPATFELLRAYIAQSDAEEMVLDIVRRAAERGEVPTATLSPRVARVAFDLARNEVLFFGGTSLDDTAVAEIVDEIVLPLMRAATRTTGSSRGPQVPQ